MLMPRVNYTSQFVNWYLSIVSCVSNMDDNLKTDSFISKMFYKFSN